MDLATLKSELAQYRYRFDTEADLQVKVGAVLSELGLEYQRELVLDPKNCIDFLVGGIGIEVKVNGSLAAVTRQVHRYLGFEAVESLLLFTTRSIHGRLPDTIQGKRVAVLTVGGIL
jgi:hypothetical protein